MNRFLKYWRITGRGEAFQAQVINYADDFVILRAAVGLALPYERGINSNFRLPGARPEDDHTAVVFYVTPDYFRALRIPLLGGRAFTHADGPQAAKVVVVNEACANLYFPRRNPIGMRIKGGEDDLEIIGLVGNVPMEASSVGGYAPLAAVPVVFFPVAIPRWFSFGGAKNN